MKLNLTFIKFKVFSIFLTSIANPLKDLRYFKTLINYDLNIQ